MKKYMHRGIYEQNLALIGRKGRPRLASGLTLPKKLLLSLYLAFVFVVFHGTFLSVQWFPEGQIRAGLLTVQAGMAESLEIPEGTFTGEEYQALIRNHDIPLWRLLGMEVKTIMLDPGHGGRDSGAVGRLGTMEKDLALDIASRLRDRLEKHDRYRVVMTREKDVTVPLRDRVELSSREGADLFVSIHLNYLPTRPINIIETFYFGPSDDISTARLAEMENASSNYGLNDFKRMVTKLNDDLKVTESRELAVDIQRSLYASSRSEEKEVYDYGIKSAPFVVLLGADVPAVLVEVSCLSNIDEENDLNTVEHRENIARYLETGILDYLSRGEVQHVAKR